MYATIIDKLMLNYTFNSFYFNWRSWFVKKFELISNKFIFRLFEKKLSHPVDFPPVYELSKGLWTAG